MHHASFGQRSSKAVELGFALEVDEEGNARSNAPIMRDERVADHHLLAFDFEHGGHDESVMWSSVMGQVMQGEIREHLAVEVQRGLG